MLPATTSLVAAQFSHRLSSVYKQYLISKAVLAGGTQLSPRSLRRRLRPAHVRTAQAEVAWIRFGVLGHRSRRIEQKIGLNLGTQGPRLNWSSEGVSARTAQCLLAAGESHL